MRAEYVCIDAYQAPTGEEIWYTCPHCGLRPLVWEFNNGRFTACGCGRNEYDHPTVRAESILSVVTRCNGSAVEYDPDELRRNWNHWCQTGEHLFQGGGGRW